MEVTTHASGPLFDGTAIVAMHEAATAIRHELARQGEQRVRAAFADSIRVNHGVFLGTITSTDSTQVYAFGGDEGRKVYTMPVVVTDMATETIVTTSDATYGPWLEGTGSRNLTTRFKGYGGFRRATQELAAAAPAIADGAFLPFVEAIR